MRLDADLQCYRTLSDCSMVLQTYSDLPRPRHGTALKAHDSCHAIRHGSAMAFHDKCNLHLSWHRHGTPHRRTAMDGLP